MRLQLEASSTAISVKGALLRLLVDKVWKPILNKILLLVHGIMKKAETSRF